MAKLTEEQKALNKAAASLRQKAFTARRREYQATIEAIEASVKASDVYRQVQAANAAFEAALQARNAAMDAIRGQIRQLEGQLKTEEQEHGQRIEAARDQEIAARRACHAAESTAKAPVVEAYADIHGCFGPGAWKALEDFFPLVGPKG